MSTARSRALRVLFVVLAAVLFVALTVGTASAATVNVTYSASDGWWRAVIYNSSLSIVARHPVSSPCNAPGTTAFTVPNPGTYRLKARWCDGEDEGTFWRTFVVTTTNNPGEVINIVF